MTSAPHGHNGSSKPPFTIYSIENCAFCERAKGLFESRGLTYREVSLTNDDAGRDDLVRRTGRMTFPQIFMFNEPIGGYEDLVAFLRIPTAHSSPRHGDGEDDAAA